MNEPHDYNPKPLLVFGGFILLIMFGVSLWGWVEIPTGEKMPVHWGMDGEVDRYGSKFEGLFMVPLIMVGMVALMAGIPYIEPRKLNLKKSQKAYQVIVFALFTFMAVVHTCVVLNGIGYTIEMGMVISVLIGILFLFIGNMLGKLRSNFFVGIRTPWTLSSDLAWQKTHRLGGWLFFIHGFLIIAAALFFENQIFFWVVIGGVIVTTTISLVYSYMVWKQDPEKRMR